MKIINANGIFIVEDGKFFLYLDEEFLKNSKKQIIVSLTFDIKKVKLDGTFNPGSLEYFNDTLVKLKDTVKIGNHQVSEIYVNYSYFPFSQNMNNLKPNFLLKAKSYQDFANGKKVPMCTLPFRM